MQYTNEGDPAQEDTEQNKRNAQIRAMQHRTQMNKTQCPDKGHAARGKPVTGQGRGDHLKGWRRLHGHPTDGGRSDDGERTETA